MYTEVMTKACGGAFEVGTASYLLFSNSEAGGMILKSSTHSAVHPIGAHEHVEGALERLAIFAFESGDPV